MLGEKESFLLVGLDKGETRFLLNTKLSKSSFEIFLESFIVCIQWQFGIIPHTQLIGPENDKGIANAQGKTSGTANQIHKTGNGSRINCRRHGISSSLDEPFLDSLEIVQFTA